MNMNVHNGIANSIWNIADDVFKGRHNCPVKRIKIGLKWPFRVILVMCVTN